LEKIRRKYLFTLSITLLLALLPFFILSSFVRFQADDYCSSTLIRTQGFWRAQSSSYMQWSGRFATMFFTAIIDKLDLLGHQLLPIILILSLLISSYLIINSIINLFNYKLPISINFCISLVIVFFTLITTPNIYQSFYWRSGSITYTLPIILFNLLLVILIDSLNNRITWWNILLCSILSFITMGFSETNTAMQLVLMTISLICLLIYNQVTKEKKITLNLWYVALLSGVLGFILLLLAPGNRIRMNYMPQPPDFAQWIYLSNRYALGLLYNNFTSNLVSRFISGLIGISIGLILPVNLIKLTKNIKLYTLTSFIVVYGLLVAACAPSAFAESAYLEERAQTGANFVITFIWIIGSIFIGAYYAHKLSNKSLRMVILASLIISIIFVCWEIINFSKTLPEYYKKAVLWDARAEFIKNQKDEGLLELTVPSIDSIDGLFELSPDPNHWVNRCAAGYYQVNSISGTE